MKRFVELVAEVRERYPSDNFFTEFEAESWDNDLRRKHYLAYDDALTTLDVASWAILKGKAIEQFRNEREGQRKQAFFNQLNEAFAYRHLLGMGFEDVRFIEEGKKKSPDIRYFDQGVLSYCEVKTIGISDDEVERRSSNRVYDLGVYTSLGTGFLKKLGADIDCAWRQIHSLGQTGLVFVLVRFDDIALDHDKTYRKQLVDFCREQNLKNLVIKIGYLGNDIMRIQLGEALA